MELLIWFSDGAEKAWCVDRMVGHQRGIFFFLKGDSRVVICSGIFFVKLIKYTENFNRTINKIIS